MGETILALSKDVSLGNDILTLNARSKRFRRDDRNTYVVTCYERKNL